MSKRKPNSFRPDLTILESREVPSISSVQLASGILTVHTNNQPSIVLVNQVSGTVSVRDEGTNHVWSYSASSVNRVDVFGGSGNNTLTSTTKNPGTAKLVRLFSGNGDSVLTGLAGPVSLTAGSGNDTLRAGTGNDTLVGGSGTDSLFGGSGNDLLQAGTGNDYLNGGTGIATLVASVGNDTLVAMNGDADDTVYTGIGSSVIWVDSNNGVTDTIIGDTTGDVIQAVPGFSNPGATRVLNGGTFLEPLPLPGNVYEPFPNRPLFATTGPTPSDVKQYLNPKGGGVRGTGANLDDSWLLAGLGAIAQQDPAVIQQNVVDFGDGTYGVKLDGNYYRVDNKLPVNEYGDTFPAYASVGVQNSVWVPIVEKAFAYLYTPTQQPNYAELNAANGGVTTDVYLAFGASQVGSIALSGATGFTNAAALGQAIEANVNSGVSQAVGITTVGAGATLIAGQEYSVIGYNLDVHGNVASVILRNPMGIDGGGSMDNNPKDGFLTININTLFSCTGTLDFGTV